MRSSPAASSGEPLLFPPSSFPYPRLLPVVVFARSNRSSTRRELDVTLPPTLSPRAWVTSSRRRTPSTEAHLDLAPLMFPLGWQNSARQAFTQIHSGGANFVELRKAEVQLRRRTTSGRSATEGPPPPRPPYALPTLSHRGSGRPGLHRIFFISTYHLYSPSTVFRDEDLEAHRRAFCTLSG